MSRIPLASPPYPPSIQATLDTLMPKGVPPLALFRVMARDERLFARSIGAGLLDRGHLSLRERELVILRVCAKHGSEYEWGVHVVGFSAHAGLTHEQVLATLVTDPALPCWSARDQLLLRLCDALHASTAVSDALWAELSAEFVELALLELLLLIGFYHTISILTNALQLPLEPFAARFPQASAQPTPDSRLAPSAERQNPPVHKGSCLCGAIHYELSSELGEFGYCHCRSCRKASGSAHAANAPIDRAHFHLLGGTEQLREYQSSPGKYRAFCSDCGAPLYAYLSASPDVLRLRLGSLDTPFAERARAHTFVDDKADWDDISGPLPQFAEWAPVSVLHQRGSRQDQQT